MACPECTRLSDEFQRTAQQYARSVKRWSDIVELAAWPIYQGLRMATKDSWIDSEIARLEYEQHRRVHSTAN